MSETEQNSPTTIDSENQTISFDQIKEVASKNIGQMLQDLQAFEIAIKFERIPDIYRIYNGQLHEELKKTSNTNHEIDRLLAKKIHDSFMTEFPFMVHMEKVSETLNYYKIGEYYRERPTVAIDSSIPEIFVLPQIDQEWESYQTDPEAVLKQIEGQMDQLEAKAISAKEELAKIDDQIRELKNQEASIANTKGFFNRGKVDEELDAVIKQRQALEVKRGDWTPFINDRAHASQERLNLEDQYKQTRLNHAIVEKEFRQVDKYFGGIKEMNEKINQFLDRYLTPAAEEVGENE